VGDTWPDPKKYPDGASPAGDNDATYKYKTQAKADCHHDDLSVPRAIQVSGGDKQIEEASLRVTQAPDGHSVPRAIGVGNIDDSTGIKS